MYLDKEKLPIIYEALRENQVDAWLITGRESIMKSEPVLPVLGDMDFIIATTLIFTAEGKCIAIVSPLDVEGYKLIEGIDEVVEYQTTMEESIYEVLSKLKPKRLALDYSSSDAAADGLTVGMYKMLERVFRRLDFKMETVSAFPIVSDVRGRKTSTQIEKIRHCAVKADEYLRRVPEMCKKGTTSLDIFNFLHEVAYEDGYGMSWADSQCPGVSVDPNVPSGHMGIVSTPIVEGYLINIDYGVSKDGYCSDLQRMYYVLKEDEEDAPEEVKKAFYLVRDAIKEAKEFMREGVTGFQVDQIARHKIVDEGYDSWNAALGHQVGHQTHDGGTILANRRPRYNRPELIDTPLRVGNVFTIEPGIETPWGRVGIEEDVVITEHGTEWLAEPQQELILIRI
ncbi:M24 family metallopeptidase [uncultured Traorella sp.]|uniref:M24 family metallopeptidase n=1 Tax=uncultured Traorella sp. TaxID=1929048 RepID=UPI0025EA33CF|nr:M24 family metallopeptidase [uncultured Traorella sp.]